MEYPRNGSVVIVDDKHEEVEGLIRVLSRKSIPTLYFNEEIDKIPHVNGLRILFLDLDLKIGVNDTSEAAIISNAFAVLNKLIVKNNGGYVLVIWSTIIENYGDIVIQKINEAKEKSLPLLKEYPIEMIKLNKNEVSTRDGEKLNFDIEAIQQKIDSMISDNNILNLISHWENSVSDASKKVMNNFDAIASSDANKKELLSLFADSIQQTSNLNIDNIINPALSPLSTLLLDQLSSHQHKSNLPNISSELITYLEAIEPKKKKILSTKQVADINTFYHVDSSDSCDNSPGTIFDYMQYMNELSCSSSQCNTKWSEDLIEKVFKKINIPSKTFNQEFSVINSKSDIEILNDILEIYKKNDGLVILNKLTHEAKMGGSLYEYLSHTSDKKKILKKFYLKVKQDIFLENLKKNTIPVFLEFSPSCDYIQGKRKKLRLIFGLLIPYDFQGILKDEKELRMIKIDGDNIITTPLITYKNNIYQVVFDLHTVTGINEEAFVTMQPKFRFRKELLVDIQQKIASHIARPGFFNMNDYLK